MAAGAGALGVELGGAAIYHGELHHVRNWAKARRRMPTPSIVAGNWCSAAYGCGC
jgi:cobalamin biosynthesis protein CobD/CbiB